MLSYTFYITYVFLITTGFITFIEALRTQNPVIRHIMNLETCISVIAGYFYALFIAKIEEAKKTQTPLNYADINKLRYTDWFVSTPFMLFVLCMVLAYEKKKDFTIQIFLLVLVLDIGMLATGYLGEIDIVRREWGLLGGFVFFALMYGLIYVTYLSGSKNTFTATLTYTVFLVVWALYGVAYMLPLETRNILYNILDLIAKCFMGLFFWMYYTKSVVFRKS